MSCTTIAAGKNASETGLVLIAHNEDNVSGAFLYFGMGNEKGESLVDLNCITHEFTHLVTAYRPKGKLVYQGESGAINEGYSDAMAVAAEARLTGSANWLYGHGVQHRSFFKYAGIYQRTSGSRKADDTGKEPVHRLHRQVYRDIRAAASPFYQYNGCMHRHAYSVRGSHGAERAGCQEVHRRFNRLCKDICEACHSDSHDVSYCGRRIQSRGGFDRDSVTRRRRGDHDACGSSSSRSICYCYIRDSRYNYRRTPGSSGRRQTRTDRREVRQEIVLKKTKTMLTKTLKNATITEVKILN